MIAVWPPADVWCFAKYRGVYVVGVVVVARVAWKSQRSCDSLHAIVNVTIDDE